MESEENGSDASGAHSVTPGLTAGASSVVCCVRAVPNRCCEGPQVPTCNSSKPKTSSRATCASAASSRSTRAPSGPPNHSAATLSLLDCNHDSLKTLAKFECYRLNTPQNVQPINVCRRAAGPRLCRQLYLADRVASNSRPRRCR